MLKDAIPASSITWKDHMRFSDESNYRSNYGVTVYEMDVIIDNPSDKTVYRSVAKFYVNDKTVLDEYLARSENQEISAENACNVRYFNLCTLFRQQSLYNFRCS